MYKRTFLALFYLMFSLISAVAHAEDATTYHGTHCKAMKQSNEKDLKYNDEGVHNVSNSNVTVVCPVLQHSVGTKSGLNRVLIYVLNKNINRPGYVRCTIQSKTANGKTINTAAILRSSTGWIHFNGNYIVQDDFWGTYHLECFLTPKYSISTIWVGEDN